jgi:flagellar basal body-associated protein FliL
MFTNSINFNIKQYLLVGILLFISLVTSAQVTSSVDSTKIKIGEQITFKIQVETDTTNLVVFPEGQTFLPLEMIESYPIDTTKNNASYNLIKKYGLTQFDSGSYSIPRQKIIIGDKTFYTDSLKVEVNTIQVDTTIQGLYDIKPFIQVEKSSNDWWKTFLLILGILLIIAAILYWFIWRKKPLTEAEEIALLPPYDRAKLALKKLDQSTYLQNSEIKQYYSELTFIIRKYLDEKVYDRALESTTDELILRLNLLKDGNQIDISKEDIRNLEAILKRADLVKFAKSSPDIELAKLDRNTIDIEIDHVKEALPEPTEEEKLLDQKYKEAQAQKKKKRKIVITIVAAISLLILTFVGFSIKYGFDYVKDTILGHESKELLEGDWVKSDYGFPPITISTPRVLKRIELPLPDQTQQIIENSTTFSYGTMLDFFSVLVNTTTYKVPQDQAQQNESDNNSTIDLNLISEGVIQELEKRGAKNIIVKKEQFITPNAAEGLKTYGSMSVPLLNTEYYVEGNYLLLHFTSQNILQQVIITWYKDDLYADKMVERILNSVELKPNAIE